MSGNPVELYDRLQDLDDILLQARRLTVELRESYARLDTDALLVDDLGPIISGEEAVAGAIKGLQAISNGLEFAADGLNAVRKHGSRIYIDS